RQPHSLGHRLAAMINATLMAYFGTHRLTCRSALGSHRGLLITRSPAAVEGGSLSPWRASLLLHSCFSCCSGHRNRLRGFRRGGRLAVLFRSGCRQAQRLAHIVLDFVAEVGVFLQEHAPVLASL